MAQTNPTVPARCLRAGMRFIVNLGRSSTVRFPGAKMRSGGAAQDTSCAEALAAVLHSMLCHAPASQCQQHDFQ